MFWMCIRIASVRRFYYTSTTYDFMEKYRNFSLFIILIPTPDFPHFYYMLGGNQGSLLYGDVSVMLTIQCEDYGFAYRCGRKHVIWKTKEYHNQCVFRNNIVFSHFCTRFFFYFVSDCSDCTSSWSLLITAPRH